MRIAKALVIGAIVSIASHSAIAAPAGDAGSTRAAAGFVCPRTTKVSPDKLARMQTILPLGNAFDHPARLDESIAELRRLGLSRMQVVNHLVGAYCPAVAQDITLSDAQKSEDVRLYARRITDHVYGQDRVSDIVLNVSLRPYVADRVNAKARASGLSVQHWLSKTIEAAVQAN